MASDWQYSWPTQLHPEWELYGNFSSSNHLLDACLTSSAEKETRQDQPKDKVCNKDNDHDKDKEKDKEHLANFSFSNPLLEACLASAAEKKIWQDKDKDIDHLGKTWAYFSSSNHLLEACLASAAAYPAHTYIITSQSHRPLIRKQYFPVFNFNSSLDCACANQNQLLYPSKNFKHLSLLSWKGLQLS